MRAVILKQISWGAFLAIMLASVTADAQSRRRRGNPPAEEQQQPQQQPVTNPATGRPVTVPAAPAGTDPATMQQQAPPPSLRQDGVGTPVDTPHWRKPFCFTSSRVAAVAAVAPKAVMALAASRTFKVVMDQPSLLFTVFISTWPAPPALASCRSHKPRETAGFGAPHGRTMSHSPGKGNILKSRWANF